MYHQEEDTPHSSSSLLYYYYYSIINYIFISSFELKQKIFCRDFL